VLLYNPAVKLGDSKKFNAYYHGPFQITEQQGVNFRITPLANGKLKEQWVHQNRLKRSYFRIKPLTDVTVDHNEAARSSEEETDSDSSEDDLWVEPAIRQRAWTAVDTATGKAGQPVAKVPILPSTPEETSTAGQAAKSQLSPGPLTVRLDDQARALSPVQMGAVRAPSPVPAAVVANRAERMRDEPNNDDGSRDKTYRPGRAIGDLPRRQNPPRNRRPPVRYSDSVFEVNCIFIDMEEKN
jgi:hypothetical protein